MIEVYLVTYQLEVPDEGAGADEAEVRQQRARHRADQPVAGDEGQRLEPFL